ncbi:hypothetical protein [Mumia sp. Pv 4-285]|uniref:hypothetical protein n=1 Tax=Mumia qirimensis TaxID=3234852 RepID=UPI00351CD65A
MASPEPLDVRLRDQDVLDEIEMTSNLMIAASAASERLSQQVVDEILGVRPRRNVA